MASSSARACALIASSIPSELFSKRVEAAAVPNEVLVEDRTDTALFMFLWLLLLVNRIDRRAGRGVCVFRSAIRVVVDCVCACAAMFEL